jgi:hypothetical protein
LKTSQTLLILKGYHSSESIFNRFFHGQGIAIMLNPDIAVAIYCGLQILAATLVSRFCSSTYQWICLRREIVPTVRFTAICGASLRRLLQNLG